MVGERVGGEVGVGIGGGGHLRMVVVLDGESWARDDDGGGARGAGEEAGGVDHGCFLTFFPRGESMIG